MPGGHSSMLHEPYVQEVAAAIVSNIDRCVSHKTVV